MLAHVLFSAFGNPTLPVALGGVAVGGILWLGGACFSRSLVTLAAVAIGTLLGLRVPGWFGWSIDGMGTAIAGAVLLGVCAYLWHPGCVAVLLTLVLTLWACAGVSILVSDSGSMLGAQPIPALKTTGSTFDWRSLPAPLIRTFLITLAASGATAGLIAWRWPRFGRALTYSLLGLTLLLIMIHTVLARSNGGPGRLIPAQNLSRVAVLALLTGIGVAIQWWLAGAANATGPAVGGRQAVAGELRPIRSSDGAD